MPLEYIHCDVFAPTPYSGNSLAVFVDPPELTSQQMLAITQELRHFEAIFIWSEQRTNTFRARVFDLFEELPFAGHPVLGAACTMQRRDENSSVARTWTVELQGDRAVTVDVQAKDGRYEGSLDQGRPEFLAVLNDQQIGEFAEAFNLTRADIADYCPQVISTGLRYLVIPIASNLENARITVSDLEERLDSLGADYVYLFDPRTFEGRHWNNDGIAEDIATGSAAGPVGAFAVKHRLAQPNETFVLRQGHFIGRPSELNVTVMCTREEIDGVQVAGAVSMVGRGMLDVLPIAGD